ncbi:uncharacterized protein LOC127425011 isoform X2 [Myxocyprinus asiaticus]|uniref:uncharacterized protein LOC127425011 isoform X2 n=1 Tax=Myxocyprinus asiaticus TaxID=70543 RepID=UPI0022215D0F|nr:uncharacterized protein LOC127425011 isoform X2 [Myxocyprinus asiaticus]
MCCILNAEITMTVILLLTFLPGLCFSALTENIAFKANVVQSSTYDSLGHARNAVDGRRESNYMLLSCSHTKIENNPWWRVELPGIRNVTSVQITNRGDCCAERINGAQIRIGNSLKNNGNSNKLAAFVRSISLDGTKTFKFKPIEGKFVNVFLPGPKQILTLCEVEVFADEFVTPQSIHLHDKTNLRNLALRGRATQSSLHKEWSGFGLAQNAIDGNQNAILEKGSCSQTAQEDFPWWRVDLHRKNAIASVALTSRGDCCWEDLAGAEIRVGNSLENNGKDNWICATVSNITAGETKSFSCGRLLEGRYVTVVLPREGTLSLCEVEVFGFSVAQDRVRLDKH